MGYLISETTKEEREKIVAESLGNIDAACDSCMSGLVEMYQEILMPAVVLNVENRRILQYEDFNINNFIRFGIF